jgi:uncharacterized membrane protein
MEIQGKSKNNINVKTKDLVTSALLIAVVFVSTSFIKIPSPLSLNSGGLIHMGNVMFFMAAIVFGKKQGAIAGAFGMGIFDVLNGYLIWAPFTFIIRGVMGFTIGYFANAHGRKGNNLKWNIIGLVIASIFLVSGYFVANLILFHNIAAAISGIPGDLTQVAIGFILGVPLTIAVKKTKVFDNY